MCWSLSTLLLFLDVLGLTRLWASLLALSGISSIIAYYHFVSVFVDRKNDIAVKLGYAAVAFILVPLAVLGYLPESVSVANGMLDISYGKFLISNDSYRCCLFPFISICSGAQVQGFNRSSESK